MDGSMGTDRQQTLSGSTRSNELIVPCRTAWCCAFTSIGGSLIICNRSRTVQARMGHFAKAICVAKLGLTHRLALVGIFTIRGKTGYFI